MYNTRPRAPLYTTTTLGLPTNPFWHLILASATTHLDATTADSCLDDRAYATTTAAVIDAAGDHRLTGGECVIDQVV